MEQILNILKRLEESPPQYFEFSDESTVVYAPYHINHYQNCLFQRMIELSYGAADNIKKEKIISATTLVRTAMETFGAVHYLDKEIVDNLLAEKDIEATLEKLKRMIMANPLDNPAIKIIHVHEFIRAVNEEFFIRYSELCEFLHPNYYGVKGTYSMENLGTYKEGIKGLLPKLKELLYTMLVNFEKINDYVKGQIIALHKISISENTSRKFA